MNRRRKQPESEARRKKKGRFKRIQVFSFLPLFPAAAYLELEVSYPESPDLN
jgi:hypothetical protein